MFAKVNGSKYTGDTSSDVYNFQGFWFIDSSFRDQRGSKLSRRLIVFAHVGGLKGGCIAVSGTVHVCGSYLYS